MITECNTFAHVYDSKAAFCNCGSVPIVDGYPAPVYGEKPSDPVNSPSHYTHLPGIEVIDITEHFNFNMGNALKYILRADHKGKPEEDLRKAWWYIRRELKRRGYAVPLTLKEDK